MYVRIDGRWVHLWRAVDSQPTLFGEWALVREWGRIGSAGRLASEQEAALAMAEHLKAKLSKGYEAV